MSSRSSPRKFWLRRNGSITRCVKGLKDDVLCLISGVFVFYSSGVS